MEIESLSTSQGSSKRLAAGRRDPRFGVRRRLRLGLAKWGRLTGWMRGTRLQVGFLETPVAIAEST